MALSLFSFVCF